MSAFASSLFSSGVVFLSEFEQAAIKALENSIKFSTRGICFSATQPKSRQIILLKGAEEDESVSSLIKKKGEQCCLTLECACV